MEIPERLQCYVALLLHGERPTQSAFFMSLHDNVLLFSRKNHRRIKNLLERIYYRGGLIFLPLWHIILSTAKGPVVKPTITECLNFWSVWYSLCPLSCVRCNGIFSFLIFSSSFFHDLLTLPSPTGCCRRRVTLWKSFVGSGEPFVFIWWSFYFMSNGTCETSETFKSKQHCRFTLLILDQM